jgi:hypothetical protein
MDDPQRARCGSTEKKIKMRHEEIGSRSIKTKNLPVTRYGLLTSQSKFWCSSCQAIRVVVDYFANGQTKLDCGHRRKMDVTLAQSVAVATEVACPRY